MLEGLQTRAGTLLAASSLVTSFLGGRALGSDFHLWSIVVLGAFVATSLLTVGVLWPRHRWRFVVSPARLIAAARAGSTDDDVATAHEEVALRLEHMLDDNRTTLETLFRTFRFSCVFLIVEVAAWILELV